jgi:hypothetical protein
MCTYVSLDFLSPFKMNNAFMQLTLAALNQEGPDQEINLSKQIQEMYIKQSTNLAFHIIFNFNSQSLDAT